MCFPACICLRNNAVLFSDNLFPHRMMRRFELLLFLIVLIPLLFYKPLKAEDSMLSRYDLDNPESHLKLTPELKEISGIAVSEDGRLFAHDDEKGTVYELGMKTGEIIKRFYIHEKRWYGYDQVLDDFEDIAISGKRFYMVTSAGVIYGFQEWDDTTAVRALRHETFLNDLFDVEGLCFDPRTDALLLACKEYPGEMSLKEMLFKRKKSKVRLKPVYSFSLKTMSLDVMPRFLIDGDSLRKKSAEKKFKPSAIARHPFSGTFFVLAAKGRLLVELDPRGNVVDVARLPSKDHPQPEGLAFTDDNEMLICNEGVAGRATLLRYSVSR